jgi:ribonuclease J
MTTSGQNDELVFLPLGGVGEIGMNLGLYGYGPPHNRSWLAVDFGVAFAGPDLPGVDLIFPDISYLEEERSNLNAIVLTHAHEDHFGAIIDLWPRLRVPVYATAFTAGLLNAKLASEPGAVPIPVNIVVPGAPFTVGPFEVEYVNVAHSIPESHALAIRTPLGLVVHSGDWKIDETPVVGPPTDAERLRQIGDEGVLALICDSTNAMRDGKSPSETEVGRELVEIVKAAKNRIAFTTFASNVGRLRSVALAAAAAGRDIVVVGRAMRRVIDVATELGYLAGLPPFLDEEAFAYLPRDRVVLLLTGSQGEPRAALARVAEDDHRNIELVPGDVVVFSSRAIPGNEKAINGIINALVGRGIRVITDRDRLVHVSGHPRREELREMYGWIRPSIVVPVHGEAMHLAAHAAFARELGVKTVLTIENGEMVRLAPAPAEQIDEIAAGRIYKDGRIIGDIDAVGVAERRKLSFAGHVVVSVILDAKGNIVLDPELETVGLPRDDGAGRPIEEAILSAAVGTLESLSRARRRDPDAVSESVRRAVRAAVRDAWGKKPICTVFVAIV